MRSWLALLLLPLVDRDAENALLVLLPLAALLFGLGMGVVFGREGLIFQFKNHLDKHFFSDVPDAQCVFCRHERGNLYGVGGPA